MPTVREFEAALQRNPADTEAFVSLRKAYRQAQKHDRLVTLYETRAQAIEDNGKAGELFYLAAELRLDQLGDAEGAEADLVNAVDRDPTHIRAAARLKDIYREQGRTADYMTMLEMEAAAVARTRDPARMAELEAEMSQLFLNHFARLERAVRSPQRQGKLAQEHVRSIESARKIYRALGDWRGVVRLYELELEGTSEARRRADLLLGLGRVLSEKLEELDAAAQRLTEVVRLRPRDEKALELLAAVYANPNWIGADGADRAAAIYHQVARRRQEAGDVDNAISALRKALAVVPGHPESSELLERVYYEAQRYQELDRYYRERIAGAPDNEGERIDFLYKRAQLAEGELDDRVEAQRIYNEITLLEPPGGPASEKLVELYLASQDYAKLAELRERQLGAVAEPQPRLRIMLELAALYRDRLGDREQAAVYLHAVLELEPENQAALAAYADHFRNKGDWAALADLLEFSYERARVAGMGAEDLVPRLEEIAAVCEKQLGDNERALAAWQRAEELAPAYSRPREAQRRLLLKTKSWDRMAALLEREAVAQPDLAQRMEILRRAAQIHREKLGNAPRAIEIYREILRADPTDGVSMRAVVETYERAGDFGSLALLLREQIERTESKQERVGLLRRVLVICDERLDDLPQGQWAATEILKAVPGDRDTLTRLENILERAGAHGDLVKVLDQHAKHAASPDEKSQIYHRIADIMRGTLRDPAGAAERLEEVVRFDPDDGRALDLLGTIYGDLGRHGDLARVLDLQVERVVADSAQQAEYLRQAARLVEGSLGDLPRARRSWQALLDLLPTDAEALEGVARIAASEGDWGTLVSMLDRQIPLAAEPGRAVELALQRARIFDEKLNDVDAAAETLERLIAELDPRNFEAHARLRAYYERDEDWPRVIKVAERQLNLVDDPALRLPKALELGALVRDRLEDDKRAIPIFERVLEMDPENIEALQAVAALYEKTGNHQRLAYADEKLLEKTDDPDERRVLILQIAGLYEKHLGDPRRGFEWYRRAYLENPDAEALKAVDEAADRHGLFEELIQIYEGARDRASEPFEQLAASLKIALICEKKVGDASRAFNVLADALAVDPAGRELLPNLERIAGDTQNWAGLLDVYARIARARTETSERVELLRLRADVREQKMGDPSGALDEMLRSFAIAPENTDTREEILRLARETGRWEEAIRVQGQLFALADALPEKLAIAREAAHLVEHEVKDLVRAFRAYLNAFRLAPEEQEIVAHLWRLAAAIGRYHVPGAPSETDETDDISMEMEEASGGTAVGASPEDGATLIDGGAPPAETKTLVDATAEVSDSDVAEASGESLEGREGESEAEDGIEVIAEEELIEESEAPEPTDPGLSGLRARPPAPPPVARGSEDDLPFETPWEELAAAYDTLPAADRKTRRAYLLKIVDIWERGHKNPDLALDALERAFRLDTTDAEVRAEIERIGGENDRWDRVVAIYLGGIDEFAPVETAVALHHDVARLRESLGQVDRVEEIYQHILRLRPDDPIALKRVEEIYRDQQRWEDLANVLEKRTTGPSDAITPAERRARMRELATLYQQHLERPYEAIDTLERLLMEAEQERDTEAADPAGPEELVDAHGALSRLYSRVGLWAKVVESLGKQAELVADRQRARALRLEIAAVYEKELALAERAIEAYESILLEMPDDGEALAALDRLNEGHGRFEELQEILRRRAALVTGAERTALVQRRARLLEERLDNPEAAASALRDLGAEAIAHDDMLAALLRNLRRAGLSHEAARALSQRIELERGKGKKADAERIAELNLELSLLKLDDLGDPVAARREVEAALEASPDHPAALAALARLHLQENDYAGYSAVRLREARALKGRPGAVEALLDAGRVYREQLAAPDKARECFEEALREDATNAEAMRALAALHAGEANWEEARRVLTRQLEVTEDPTARAAVLTDLARTAWEGFTDGAEAMRLLDEALALVPDHLPAILAIADIYYKEGQWENAEHRLSEAVRRLRSQPQQAAKLLQRLAEVHEKLGKLDEAYRQLVEAERMGPGQLLTKLSLGENRFRAGRWREAALHLGGLADHADAALYPEEVADALAHAAQAEIKLRHPERAIELYESALNLRGGHLHTLRALADLALERGEKQKAASYLRRIAEAATDRGERSQTYERLGDLLVDVDDRTQALAAYGEALRAEGAPSDDKIPLIEKMVKVHREAGDADGAALLSLTLIDLVKDPRERAGRRRDAALLMAERGDVRDAAELLEQALTEDPQDEAALAALCDLADKLPTGYALAERLARVLANLPPPGPEPDARARRARLWLRHGEMVRTRDPSAAIEAFQLVVTLEPDNLPAREALAALFGDRPGFEDASIENHRRLLEADVTRAGSLRALASAYARRKLLDRARCLYEVLALFGEATEEERAFLAAHPVPALQPDDPYAAALDDEERRTQIALPEATRMADIFSCLWEGTPGLVGQHLEDFGVSARDKISPMSDLDIGKIYGQVTKALGNKKTSLYAKSDGGGSDVIIVVQTPPALVVGSALATDAPAAEVRFQLARGIELSRPEYILAAGVRPKQFATLFASVLRAFHPRHARRRVSANDAAAEQAAQLKKNVPYKVSKQLVELFQSLGSTSWSSLRWRAVVHQVGNRVGLLLCGELATAARLVIREGGFSGESEGTEAADLRELAGRHEPLRELLRFAVSDNYFALRERLGTAVPSAAAA